MYSQLEGNRIEIKDKTKFKIPASRSEAQFHASCYFTGKRIKQLNAQNICNCCQRYVKQQLDFSFSHQETYKNGSGVSLFFYMILLITILLIVKFFLADLPRIVTNEIPQTVDRSSLPELLSTNTNSRQNTPYLDLVTVVILIISCLMIRRFQLSQDMKADQKQISQNDFSIFVKNFPPIFRGIQNMQYTIKQFFNNKLGQLKKIIGNREITLNNDQNIFFNMLHFDQKVEVEYVSCCYNVSSIQNYQNLQKKVMNQCLQTLYQVDRYNPQKNQKYVTMLDYLQLTSQCKTQFVSKFQADESEQFNVVYFTGKCFIIFSHECIKNSFLNYYSNNKDWLLFDEQSYLQVQDADNPLAINWFNMHYSDKQRLLRKTLAILAICVILVYSFAIIYFLFQLKQINETQENYLKKQTIGLLSTSLIVIFNFVIDLVIKKLVDYQKHVLLSHARTNYVVLSFIAKFANTSLVAFLIYGIKDSKYFGKQGLFAYISDLVLTNAGIVIFTNIVHVGSVMRWLNLLYIKFRFQNKYDPDKVFVSQQILNQAYQYPLLGFETHYTSILTIFATVMFYSWGCPYISLILGVQLLILFPIYRYNYAKRSSIFYENDLFLSYDLVPFFQISIILFGFSNIAFPLLLGIKIDLAICLVNVGVPSLYFLFINVIPLNYLKYKIFCIPPAETEISYSQALEGKNGNEKLIDTYKKHNPANL